jgi:hypothetical protein
MAAVDRLAEMINDPQVRDLLLGLSEEDDDAARARVVNAVARLTAEACGADGVTSTQVALRPISTDDVRGALGDDAIVELAQFMRQTPEETADQLAVVLPDLLDASAHVGEQIKPDEMHRALRAALSEGIDTAGPFASDPD